jgi:hypothetical protein
VKANDRPFAFFSNEEQSARGESSEWQAVNIESKMNQGLVEGPRWSYCHRLTKKRILDVMWFQEVRQVVAGIISVSRGEGIVASSQSGKMIDENHERSRDVTE